ncbi:diacylglycerol/lipid kinase family protein [Microbacterium gilvum]|uniref:Diacylglycerol kinase family protein n=1 Tax=Microbacterium gilvum TaxID=1336204 RepID=A0ABP9ATA3_9MICO
MADESIAIVWNPSKTSRDVLEKGLEAAGGADASWYETTPEDAGQRPASEALAAGAQVVVAAGGDGTVRAVAERLAGTSAELGIVPLGTGNLLARNLGVPLTGPKAAFARILAAESREIDLGWIEGTGIERQAFAVMAGFGIDAHMIVETDETLKSRVGWLAYVESLGRAVTASETLALQVSVDGSAVEEVAGHTLLVGNCGMLQGGITLMPDADPSDGELDLLLLSAEGVAGWLDTFRSFVWDNGIRRLVGASETAVSADTTTHARARSITVELPEPRVLEIDGEDLGEVTRFAIEVQPGAVRVR